MFFHILLLVIGFVLLISGANGLVAGASSLARKYHVSDLTIGLTIVAFGTSAPELVVNIFASFQGHHDMLLGNVIGSNNFNLFIILGLAGLITPLAVQSSTVWREIPLSLVAALLLFILANDFHMEGIWLISRLDGSLLLLLFGGFLFYLYRQLKTKRELSDDKQVSSPTWKVWLLIVAGLSALVLGGMLIVDNAVLIAKDIGISEKVIGLTIVAAGTSLPELATSVVAAIKKKNDIALGNIIGSNIFNITLILGISALISPVPFAVSFNSDLLLLAFGTLILFSAMFTGDKKKLDRWEAGTLLLIYAGYTVYEVLLEVG